VSEQGVLPGLWPIQGDGVLARQGDLVLLVQPAGGAFTDRLLDLLASTARAGEGGRRFADLISAEYESDAAGASADGDDDGPAAVAFGPAGAGTAVAVYGTAWAEITTARGVQRLATGEPYGRLVCVLPTPVIKVRAGVRPADTVGDTDPYLRLADGVVRAVALVYAPAEVPPGTDHAAQAAAPVVAEPPAVAEASAPVQVPSPGAPVIAAEPEPEPTDLVGPGVGPSPTSLDAAWSDQAPPPGPAPVDEGFADQGVVHAPTSLDMGWRDQAPPPGPAPVDQGFADQGVVHSPTSLDVSWRDQIPTPGGFDQGPHFDPVPQAPADPYGQPPYQFDPGPGGAVGAVQAPPAPEVGRDFVALPLLGGQPPDDMPQRDPLPLGAEPLGDKALGPGEAPAPVVMGIYCKNGHFDDPEARYCAVCGIGMAQLTKVPQEGRRPPLGVLVLDDGSVCQLDADYVMGREPTLDKSVADGRARPLRLGGASDLVSRIHARVELEGWQVYVADLNSANGTYLVLPGETTGTKLAPGVRTPLVAGAQIRLGDAYALRYDSHRHR